MRQNRESMKQYLLLILENDPENTDPPISTTGHIEKYSAWAKQLSENGHFVTADGVTSEVRTLRPGKPTVSGDAATAGKQPTIGGYYILKAESFEQAEEIARNCPALEFGETIELREQMDYEN